jgi:hypothetical protein
MFETKFTRMWYTVEANTHGTNNKCSMKQAACRVARRIEENQMTAAALSLQDSVGKTFMIMQREKW